MQQVMSKLIASWPAFSEWQPVTSWPDIRGGIGARYRLTARKNLAVLDWDGDFIRPFVEQNGQGGGYVGMGKTLEALTRMAAYLRDEKLLALRRKVLDELARAQSADGYLGTYRPAVRIRKPWDVHEMSYLLLALLADWRLSGEDRSLKMARRLGRHLVRRLAVVREFQGPQIRMELVLLGLDRALLALFHATGERAWLAFLENRLRLPEWSLDIVPGRHGPIAGHAYAWLTRCLTQLELFAATGDRRLLNQTPKLLRHLFQEDGLLITGACGLDECWNADQNGAGHVGETCATAYLIRLADMLARLTGHGQYADLAECAIYNALFAAQSPDGRKLRYYTPLQGARVYWPKDTYCCPGNFRRVISELPRLVYYCRPAALRVNLYETSRVRLTLGGVAVELRQQTQYPVDGNVLFEIRTAAPARFELHLRVPDWAEGCVLAVNGRETGARRRQGYVVTRREWRDRDRVELALPMPVRLVAGRKLQAGRAAVMRGPLVYCADPADSPAFSAVDFPRVAFSARAFQIAPARFPGQLGPTLLAPARQVDPENGRLRRGNLILTPFPNPDGQCTYFGDSVGGLDYAAVGEAVRRLESQRKTDRIISDA